MIPTIGRTVLYTVTEQDAQAINRRRTTGASIAERTYGTVPSEDGCVMKGALWPVGAQAHIGNEVKAGDVFPLVIVRTWGDTEGSAFNGQLMLDGTDTFWVTSTSISDEPAPGYCHVPPRVMEKPSASPTLGLMEATAALIGGGSPAPQPATAGLSFSDALDAVKSGKRAAREGWNGKGQWVALSGTELRPARVPVEGLWSPHSRAEAERQGGSVEVLPAVILRNAQGQIVMGWAPSQGDLLAEDWCILPD